ncbi:aspartic peptidase domain-containing protein [Trichoderma longibrachiatum]|uniref:Acid protease n=1 Tax=Trichoderma longibrachiatum ATCC 18648 TaxID=983965 RepID=A0A2T4BYI6_TRILO|nr:acid protease [Trichoderma longibrachiatum ATCC 18648]
MRSVQYISLAGLFAAATVSAGVVTVPFEKRNLNPEHALSLLRRDGSVSLDAINNLTGGGYYAQFSVGTPPQKLSFLLDTGSSDTWVNSVTTDLCTDELTQQTVGEYCFRQFNPRRSSSYKSSTEVFDITYLDGRRIRGNYFKDTVTINDASITGQQLGLALQSVRGTGILGLGFRDNEASDTKYPTVVENLVSQKVIPVPAFSLYLNDLQTSQGILLFGGVDTDKFHGGIATLPLQSLPPSIAKTQDIVMYSVNLDGFSASDVDTPDVSAKAVLDSGSTITLLPDAVVQEIFDEYDVLNIQGLPIPLVDCAKAKTKDATFNFKFDGKTIKVPIDEMVLNNLAAASDQLLSDPTLSKFFKGWSGVCTFGMSSTKTYGIESDEFVLLGDTFLRSAYVVYDLQNKQIGIAQATLNSTTSSIVEFKAGSKTIPGPASTGDDDSDDSSDDSDEDSAGAAIRPTFSIALAGTLFMAVSMMMSGL